MDRLRHAIARAGRGRKPLAVLMIDLDRFKPVNDSFGHTTGDDLLQEVGRRIAGCVRETDTVARLGSDEFAVVLSDLAEPRQADLAARHVMAELGRPFAAGGREVFLTASIGIAVYPTDATEAERLLGNADSAMRDAKRQGRNAYHFFRPELHREAVDRLRLETDLRRALERGELAVFYQPIFELSDGRLAGAEALLRWRHPELGLVGPDRFVPLAEETGLIIPIGEWVIETACAEVRAWTATPGCRDFHIAVNVSSRQFRSAQLVQKVADALLGNGLKPYHLVLEITESMLMEERKEIAATLKGLDELGVRLSVDDFGTGYSSLNYLKRFPVANLKIDRSFVRDVTTDPEDAALVEGVIAIARGLHLDVVGDGIENAEQLAFLRERGVRYGQGYHFKAPVPAEVFAALLPQPA
jgi:diguanylate cyclase (GGDEF)-like protein